MARTGDMEDVCQAIAETLDSDAFRDALDAVDAEKGDDRETPDLRVVYPHERAEPESYPCAQVVAYRTVYDPDADQKSRTLSIGIVFGVVGDNEALITQDLKRLVRAAVDLFWRSVLGGSVGLQPILVEAEDYGELTPVEGAHPLLKGARLALQATTHAA